MYSRLALFGTLVCFATSSLSPTVAYSEDDIQAAAPKEVSAKYRESVSALLELSNAPTIGEQIAYSVAQETLGGIASTGTPITEQMQALVVEEALAEFGPTFGNLEYLTNLYAPLYAEHLSEKEVAELLAFYQSPLGKKTAEVLPVIGQSAMLSLQEASIARMPQFQAKVEQKMLEAGITAAP